ncbi:SGNH/GDSL hydrolase family protein [Streptacidiphilus sp. 4-A2]|nr:SGNH/GDSL hydrolase family protein [Streptacidiphilus sp. 4-A2]
MRQHRRVYSNQLYAKLKKHDPQLQLVRLGCSGETTQTMINGGICSYSQGSQLAAAEAFLRAHRGEVRYVTLDIGANDVDGCATAAGLNAACAEQGVATVAKQLPQIAAAVHRAGGFGPQYVGMTYYDPFLAAWLTGTTGQEVAHASVQLSTSFNEAITQGLHDADYQVADVAKGFATDNFTTQVNVPGLGELPENVARICEWTWECTPYQNIHANDTGYGEIAKVFARTLRHHHR